MSRPELRVGLVVEDVRFVEFLPPAVRRLADRGGRTIRLLEPLKVRGCRPTVLAEMCARLDPACDMLVVGADASGSSHVGRGRTRRQKERNLRPLLARFETKLLLAIAEPSVEAWLMADAGAFAGGMEEGLGRAFARPREWPVPRREREAKETLGRLIRDGTGAILPRRGFEYAEEIVSRTDLARSSSPSLAAWARSFLRSVGRT